MTRRLTHHHELPEHWGKARFEMSAENEEKQQEKTDRDKQYEADRKVALELMEKGFHLGCGSRVSRDELHERER
jgi:hypothetical protein